MDPSKDHNNWIAIGEIIRLVKKPVTLYTSQIVLNWHTKLVSYLLSVRCASHGTCERERDPIRLCATCKCWYDELARSHRTRNQQKIKWRENCDTSKWPDDPWEVAKFFMPALGDNKGTVKDAKSTDLSSLLNVLEWMEDVAFPTGKRVDLYFVRKLRSEVRNPWAHAPNQEMTDAVLKNAFTIANSFAADLGTVFSCHEVTTCMNDIQFVQANGLTNVFESYANALNLLRDELSADVNQMKDEIKHLKEDQSSDRQIIEKHERKLENLENRNQETEKDISETRAATKSLMQDMANLELTYGGQCRVKSCIPDKPQTFVGRKAEVEQIISFLVGSGCGIVSIVGGPGFGKSTVAAEVSHHLCDEHDIVVIFSYLSDISTVPEVILRLCHDVGVIPGEDPKSSLMVWLKNIEKKVVLVMDNIEQLLEKKVRSHFTELVVTLRKNSVQQLQILTTTRTIFSIPAQTYKNVRIGVLDENSSVELLRKYCPNEKVTDGYLSELAKLCGCVPLALSIAGSRIPDLDDPFELIQWLQETPMEALQTCDNEQSVQKAIEFSFQMLSDEDMKALVRLSVFVGNFRRNSAQEVIERNGLKTQDFLKKLVARSLIQSSIDKRFVIHSLIRRFLADHEQLQGEKGIAQGLMVKHFLKVCHSFTMDSYSKDGFNAARESLMKDAHNVEESLIICSRDEKANLNSSIIESLATCDIFKSSSRFFYNFSWDLLPQMVSWNFYESCTKLAERINQPAIKMTFQCLVADQEGRKSGWNSPEYIDRMEAIKKAFERDNAVLKEDRSLYMYCYYFYGRYSSHVTHDTPYPDLPDDLFGPLPKNKERSNIEKADDALILVERGRLNKKRASKEYRSNREKYEEYMKRAESFYIEALSSTKSLLGDHEFTCTCHKLLGDLYLAWRKNEKALEYYSNAIELRKKLQLDSNEAFVYLLKNCGSSLRNCGRFDESVEKLNEARDIAEKLAEQHTPCRANVYYQLAKTYCVWKPDCQEASKYAHMAIEMQKFLDPRSVPTLKSIIERAEEQMARENAQQP